MPNIANIDRLIGILKKDKGVHFSMQIWRTYLDNLGLDGRAKNEVSRQADKYEQCNTAFCLGGWIAWLDVLDSNPGVDPKTLSLPSLGDGDYVQRGAEFLGVDNRVAWTLFYNTPYNHIAFDKYPHEMRANAAIRALELLKVDGLEHWMQALRETGFRLDDWDHLLSYVAPQAGDTAPPSIVA
jgi:hypothetical protein